MIHFVTCAFLELVISYMKSDREILNLAVPAIISNITVPLLSLADSAIVGHLGAAAYLAAIAVGSSMFNMVYWLLGFLRMGTSGLTAQACGAADRSVAEDTLYRGLAVAVSSSLLLILLSPLIADVMMVFMSADAPTSELARTYFRIVIFGAPAVLGTYVLSGWFLGMQDSRAPMWIAVLTNVVNIIVSLLLVYVFQWGMTGVACGTVSAQWIGLIAGLLNVKSRYKPRWPGLPRVMDRKALRRFFSVNSDIFLRTLCLVAVSLWFTRAGSRQGTGTLAANALLMQLFLLFSYFMDGFAFAAEALSGKYLGRADRAGLLYAIKAVFRWGAYVSVVFTILYAVAGSWILSLLTDNRDVIETAGRFLPWAVAVPLAGLAAFAWDGVYIGLTRTRAMLRSMIISMTVFFCGYALLTPAMGNHGLWLAFLIYLFIRGIVLTVDFFHTQSIKTR